MKKKSSIDKKLIADVLSSNYEFNRFEKSSLASGISCESWSHFSEPYDKNEESINYFCQILLSKMKQKILYCFISSPFWVKNNKVVSYYGLRKFLEKEYGISELNFSFEESIEIESSVIFYGVIKLNKENLKSVIALLSQLESGFIFTQDKVDNSDYEDIINEAKKNIASTSCQESNYLHIPLLINATIRLKSDFIYIYSWQETGSYHLDVFSAHSEVAS